MDIEDLFRVAEDAAHNAYSPYSGYSIGAAVETASGEVFSAANVESGAFNPSTHAEQNAVATAVSEGYREFEAIAIADLEKTGVVPCGHCRQILSEFCDPEFEIYSLTDEGHRQWTLGELFPTPFQY